MRMAETQVKAAILSPDRDVRGAAVFYLAYSDDPSILPLAIQTTPRPHSSLGYQTVASSPPRVLLPLRLNLRSSSTREPKRKQRYPKPPVQKIKAGHLQKQFADP